MMGKLSTTDSMVVIGLIGVFLYFVMMYAFGIPTEGMIGRVWVAWIVISGLLLGFGILIKAINSRKSSD